MKKITIRNFFLGLIIVFCGLNGYAQKASDRPISSELKKLKEMKETRKQMLQRTQQTASKTEIQATTVTADKTKQLPATKPSVQPMVIPARSKRQ